MRYIFAYYQFGMDLREWREREGLSQADVAELCGVSHATIGGWGRGHQPGMLMENLLYACDLMEADPRIYFVEFANDIPY